ncbi:MAG TPA: galactokinase family protein [Lacipirellulaceae bacterium]|jgi:galactokinase|nr:galactokinase family protein [Lacipirellulaceae bacterium]
MMLSDWMAEERVAARLTAAGIRENCGALAASCFVQAATELTRRCIKPDEPVLGLWVPGRIEVLGKHTDYCGGQSLLAAVERGFSMLAAPASGRMLQMIDARQNESCEFPLDEHLQPQIGRWSNYPQTVARRVARNFPHASRGSTIAFVSNLPASSGMSSSSALIVGTFLALADVNDLARDETYRRSIRNREDLAGYLATMENGMSFGPFDGDAGVGTFGGSEDHTAILNCQSDTLSLYSYCPLRFRRSVTIDDRYVLAIASSGVIAEKTGDAREKYNRISALAAEIVRLWTRATNQPVTSLTGIINSAPDAEDRLRHTLKDASPSEFTIQELTERLDHLVIENGFVASVPDRLDADKINEFGALALQSHRAAAQLLKNQTPETNRLVDLAMQLGAHGASAFGAGFGGSVWAIIDSDASARFLTDWQRQYENESPEAAARATFFVTRPGPPAITWSN